MYCLRRVPTTKFGIEVILNATAPEGGRIGLLTILKLQLQILSILWKLETLICIKPQDTPYLGPTTFSN